MILKAAVTFSFVAPPPTSRKLAGLAAIELDDVHGRHGEAGAVHHAADIAVERDVGEIEFRASISLASSSLTSRSASISGWRYERVVVEIDLGIEAEQLAVLGDDQRIDLEQAHVLGDEGPYRPPIKRHACFC